MKLLYFILFAVLITIVQPVFAAQPVIFSQNISPTAKIALSEILEGDITAYSFSSSDLNGDGLFEYIAKNALSCEKTCVFNVLALNSEGFALNLGKISARTIQIEETKHHGIHDIAAFGNTENDFARTLYIWDTAASQYIMEE
jgi:hypothetical protein